MESSYSYCWDWNRHQKSQYPPPSTVLLLPANDEVWWDIKADHVLGEMALLGQEDLAKFSLDGIVTVHPMLLSSLLHSASIAIWQLSQQPHLPSSSFPLTDVSP